MLETGSSRPAWECPKNRMRLCCRADLVNRRADVSKLPAFPRTLGKRGGRVIDANLLWTPFFLRMNSLDSRLIIIFGHQVKVPENRLSNEFIRKKERVRVNWASITLPPLFPRVREKPAICLHHPLLLTRSALQLSLILFLGHSHARTGTTSFKHPYNPPSASGKDERCNVFFTQLRTRTKIIHSPVALHQTSAH